MTEQTTKATDPRRYADRRAHWTTERLQKYIAEQELTRRNWLESGQTVERITASIVGSRMVLADRDDA